MLWVYSYTHNRESRFTARHALWPTDTEQLGPFRAFLANPRDVGHKSWRSVPKVWSQNATKRFALLLLNFLGFWGGRDVVSLSIIVSDIARFLAWQLLSGFLVYVIGRLSGSVYMLHVWSKVLCWLSVFFFFGSPKNHSSATCQIESATELGELGEYVDVNGSIFADCPILHNSPSGKFRVPLPVALCLLFDMRFWRLAFGGRWFAALRVTSRCEAKRGWHGSL